MIALVLGPLAEESLRQSLIISDGSFDIFVERSTSVGLLCVIAVLVAVPLLMGPLKRRARQRLEQVGERRAGQTDPKDRDETRV